MKSLEKDKRLFEVYFVSLKSKLVKSSSFARAYDDDNYEERIKQLVFDKEFCEMMITLA